MKIPSGTQNTQPRTSPDPLRPGDKRGVNADAAEGVESPDTETAARDFASVLDEMSSAGEGERREGDTHNDRLESEPKDRAAESPFTKRREERKGGDSGGDAKGGGFEQRAASLRETTSSAQEQPGARLILHIADLERIVSAVRTQTLAGGVREVTIELRRSVLEGLRVKLSTDGAGRVSAEFIAASERVRAQVDARASELADLMRSRGINLAEVRAGVGDSGADSRGGGHDAESGEGASNVARAPGVASTAGVESDVPGIAGGEESGTTYRG
ncbi:MAG TPA: flagellar hook-length control protein FliK [Pyrinomonadaceae bacterium]|jgi:hypothetical protein|nr:flagellar hook-length control protein FliK [Pyrinomonadaceae bacterium]